MPIKHAALKQLRKDRRRVPRNRALRSALKTLQKQVGALLDAKKRDEVLKLLPSLMKRFDQAAAKGVIAKNAASRTKSRVMRRLAKLAAA